MMFSKGNSPADPPPSQIDPSVENMIVANMQAMGLDPSLVYAFQHTGLLVTNETIDRYTDAQLLGWQSAIDRYRRVA